MTPVQFHEIMPKARSNSGLFVPLLNAAMAEFGVDSTARQAAFLATLAHESAQLTVFEENLNYSAEQLLRIWPARFTGVAVAYARQPERIANRAYAGREGNGDEKSGDGWRNRGAGAIQLTFDKNHAACARYFGIPRDQIAAWLQRPEGACRSAGWFWMVNRLNTWADAGDFDGVCDVVNHGKKTAPVGDSIGWADRLACYEVARRVFA